MDENLKKSLSEMGDSPDTSTGLELLILPWSPENYYASNLYVEALKQIRKLLEAGEQLAWRLEELDPNSNALLAWRKAK